VDIDRWGEYQTALFEREAARRKLGNLMSMDRPTRSQAADEKKCRETIGITTRMLQKEGVLDAACLLTPEALRLGLRII